ncbi:hypothetical protein LCGC14_0691520 [marine sediment metagenome]|uniref:Uncharacterized protein n=1 Tax=marine sediment metagenome TaxID=412755 RepID=A0A0F9QQ84_9ZZZZ
MTNGNIEGKGRGGDSIVAHLTRGEIVIPAPFADDGDFRQVIETFFKENGVDIQEFIVGSDKNKINPETGHLEFGFFGKLFREVKRPFVQTVEEIARVGKKLERENRRLLRQGGVKPKRIDTSFPEQEPQAAPIQFIQEEAGRARRRQRRRLSRGGPRQTILGGIQSALLKRKLGE